MAEFIFQCPNCSSFMTVEESWIGMEVTCPQCQESVTITAPETVTDAVEEPTENKDNILNNIKKINILAKLSKKQKILFGTAVILLLSGIGWGGWNYITYKNAKELAETKEQRLAELKRAVPVIFHKFIEKHISEFKDIEQTKLFNIPQEWIVLEKKAVKKNAESAMELYKQVINIKHGSAIDITSLLKNSLNQSTSSACLRSWNAIFTFAKKHDDLRVLKLLITYAKASSESKPSFDLTRYYAESKRDGSYAKYIYWLKQAVEKKSIPGCAEYAVLLLEEADTEQQRKYIMDKVIYKNMSYSDYSDYLTIRYFCSRYPNHDPITAVDWKKFNKTTAKIINSALRTQNEEVKYVYAMTLLTGLDDIEPNFEKAKTILRDLAAKNHKGAMNWLFLMALEGSYGSDKSEEQALAMAKKLSTRGSRKHNYWCGQYFLKKENSAEALKYFNLAAQAQYPPVFTTLGNIYTEGTAGIKKDQTLALKYYKTAATLGDVQGSVILAKKLLSDNTIQKTEQQQILDIITKTALKNPNPQLCEIIGDFYRKNNDNVQAYMFYALAGKDKKSESAEMMKQLYKDILADLNKILPEVTRKLDASNINTATKMLQKYLDAKITEANTFLETYFYKNDKFHWAVDYFKPRADQNDPVAMRKLAIIYLRQLINPPAHRRDVPAYNIPTLFDKAAKLNDTISLNYCGYWKAKAGKHKQAFEYFRRAANQGDMYALHNVVMMYGSGIMGWYDMKKALKYYPYVLKRFPDDKLLKEQAKLIKFLHDNAGFKTAEAIKALELAQSGRLYVKRDFQNMVHSKFSSKALTVYFIFADEADNMLRISMPYSLFNEKKLDEETPERLKQRLNVLRAMKYAKRQEAERQSRYSSNSSSTPTTSTCDSCGGSGQVYYRDPMRSQGAYINLSGYRTCGRCGGSGRR